MKAKYIDRYLSKYRDIRGTVTKKRRYLFGKSEMILISNGKETATVKIGRALGSMYPVGSELTIGHIGRKLINIRPGIVSDEE